MKTNSIFILLLITSFLVACNNPKPKEKAVEKPAKTESTDYPTQDNEIVFNTTKDTVAGFRHNKEYINPLVIYSFTPWPSDQFPYWQEIDLTEADGSNRFYNDGKLETKQSEKHNCPEVIYSPRETEALAEDFSSFSYVYLGRLSNGVELIEYTQVSTGSSINNGLMAFSFSKRKVAGDSSKHIFMREEKSFSLQQYCKFELDKKNNRVLIKPKQNMAQADFSDLPKNPFYVKFDKEATEALKASLEE